MAIRKLQFKFIKIECFGLSDQSMEMLYQFLINSNARQVQVKQNALHFQQQRVGDFIFSANLTSAAFKSILLNGITIEAIEELDKYSDVQSWVRLSKPFNFNYLQNIPSNGSKLLNMRKIKVVTESHIPRYNRDPAGLQDVIWYSNKDTQITRMYAMDEYISTRKDKSGIIDSKKELEYQPGNMKYENIPVPSSGFIAIGLKKEEIITLKLARPQYVRDHFKFQLTSLKVLYLGEGSIQRIGFILLLAQNTPNLTELYGLSINQTILDKLTKSKLALLPSQPLFAHLTHLSLNLPITGALFSFLLDYTFSPLLTNLTLVFNYTWSFGEMGMGDIGGLIRRQVREAGGCCEIVGWVADMERYKQIKEMCPKVVINVPLRIELE
ncbi:hypothetical protein FGO68_gene1514 [Halteria grandinella]|uniref:Uncharacterized protein n=1 Tax=Halteria grandinella TaxID=5974 RepID=A0A8J8NQH2_HALGN|nr:hypothetical protein FGO68_gene1514 [Halteria grandinella]